MPFRCDAPLPSGRRCRTLVRADGDRCRRHRPSPPATPDTAATLPPPPATPDARLAAIQASIDDVIGELVLWQRYIGDQLAHVASGGEPPSEEWMRLAELHSITAGRLGRLMRDRRALQGDASDGLVGAIAQAVTELRTEIGWDV